MKDLYAAFMQTPLAKLSDLSGEEMFHAGCVALKEELEKFIAQKLQGEEHRTDLFSKGQDDGLRWIKDHLHFIFSAET
jgi:hypothetical protein